ncbi:MAG TPA: hypothetical protein VMH61_05195, partial [Candidatus Acidoferrales bacterium]|nr:hypothetical protein [Candidatus Acidoferrales bacterium]
MRVSVAQARRLALLLAAAGLFALYFGALRTGLLNDDQLFLEDAHRLGVSAGWSAHGTLANYFRPVSRGLFFGVLAPLTGGQPFALHLALFALLLVSLALLWDLLRAFATLPGAAAGTLYFALLPLVRVDLTWISCAQDLLALAAALGALAAFRRGRDRIALLLYLGAIFSKESALPLPALLAFWAWRMDGASPRAALGRTVPFAGGALAWALAEFAFRRASAGAQPLHLGAAAAPAALAHLVQAVLGLELSRGAVSAALASVPSLVALALLGAIAALLPAGADAPGAPAPHARGAVAFALLWLLAFTVPVVPVVWYWSAYFYTLAAVGGAVLVALVAARLTRWGFLACVLCGLWWHAASCALPEFSVGAGPWSPVSHWTPYYFERAARLARELEAAMKRATPTPARGTHFFLTTLPPWAGFQSGNGAALRALYRDPSLASYFYTQFSDSTAGAGPDEFLFWDGVEFERLYAHASDRWFQVGTDLLILDHPAGAVAAFRRALDAREPRLDVAYWLGWALLWTGERAG